MDMVITTVSYGIPYAEVRTEERSSIRYQHTGPTWPSAPSFAEAW